MTPTPPISDADLAATPPSVLALLEALQRRVAELEARLDRDSSNSSKPPSSDAPWKPRPRGKARSGRKRGGQKGHEGHHRELLPVEECDAVVEHRPCLCEECGASLEGVAPTADVARSQQMELPERPVVVTEHRALAVVCPCCKKKNRARLPAGAARMLGPRLSGAAALLVGENHMGRRDAQGVLESMLGAQVSLGALSEAEETVAEALAKPCEEIHREVVAAPTINIDDTPYYEGVAPGGTFAMRAGGRLVRMARKQMTRVWTACSATASFFRIVGSRGREVVRDLVDGANGVIVSDRLASFLHLDRERWQVCWAHLLRDFEAMASRKESERLGNLLAFETNKLFGVWKRHARGVLDFAGLRREMEPVRERLDMLLEHGPAQLGADPMARGTCANLLALGPALWNFTRIPGVEPTNNAAERALRPAVRWRKRSYGTMSERGSRFVERLLTVSTTLRQRGHDALDFIALAITAHLNAESAPPLPQTVVG